MLRPPTVHSLKQVAEAFTLEKVDAPLGLRLRAWWEGCSVANLQGEESDPRERVSFVEEAVAEHEPKPAAQELECDEEEDGEFWTKPRIAVAEMLWGENEINPGGTARTMEMLGSFGVEREVNVLNIAPGLGGAARQIAKDFDAWVTCYEQDAVLAAEAANRSEMAGLTKRAEIKHCAISEMETRSGFYDCAFSREGLFVAENRENVFLAVQEGLKSRCPFLLTDYFVTEGCERDPAVAAWIEKEPVQVYPWTVEEAKELLAQTNFELRVAQDVTATLREDIFNGWAHLVERGQKSGIPEDLLPAVMYMVDLWTHRVRALDSGAVTLHRIVALKI